MSTSAIEEAAIAMTREALAQGKLIEVGFIGLMKACFPGEQPSQLQRDEMRNAFFAGAHHVFESIMCTLDGGDDPTPADLDRMGKIQAELDAFIKDFALRNLTTEGRA